MLRTRLDANLLQPKDGLVRSLSSEERVGPERFPIPSSLRVATHVHHWAQRDIDALPPELCTHGLPAQAQERSIPRRRDGDAGRERGHKVEEADTKRRVLETQSWPAQVAIRERKRSDVPDASTVEEPGSSRNADLLLQRQARHELLSARVRRSPRRAKVGGQLGPGRRGRLRRG